MKNIFKKILVVMVVIFLVGVTSIFFNAFFIPRMENNEWVKKTNLFGSLGNGVTIINKTEQVTISEDDSINKVASQAATSVVDIISISSKNTRGVVMQESKNGTGIILSSDGLIVTYSDVILKENAKYKILIFNGSSYDAELVGFDEFRNLAFLKINASNLPSIALANSNDFVPGKKLIAIGNSDQEYQNRFASGLLSSIEKTFNLSAKTVASTEKMEGVFKTDFENQKNYVGGPVISYKGEMVGLIGSEKMDGKDVYFQIPSNEVKKSFNLFVSGKLTEQPSLGVYYISITKAYALTHEIERDRGALVYAPSGKQGLAVISGSSGEKSGIKIGDIIVAINGIEINLNNPLSNLLNTHQKGEEISLLVLRGGKEIELKVKL